ncbi:MAG: SCP2 sterol-binding domain-containing protein [Spirochaetes bacterium]|nr:SCP2 sterol-binding domain-containing protein [Spirochaetota bacterium]
MKFSLLLLIISRKLKKASRNNMKFNEYIKDKKTTVLIKTEDGKKARSFIFNNGRVTSSRGCQLKADVSLTWQDAATGFSVMSSGKEASTMEAIQEGKLKIEGDANQALWFSGAIKAAVTIN